MGSRFQWFNGFVFMVMVLASSALAVDPPHLVKAIYGFSSKQAPFDSIPHDKLVGWLKAHGINAVFASSSEDPQVLQSLRRAGLPVYEEIAIFTSRALYRAHPEWRPIGRDGEALKPDGWYHGLSPNQPELRKKRLDDFRKRLQDPELDGVWLDFIRYPVRWEGKNPRIEESCFSDAALEQFEEFSGLEILDSMERSDVADLILNEHAVQWQNFKIHTITSWVKEAKEIRDEMRPEVKLGVFGVPWLENDFDNAIHRIVGQDFRELARHIDIFSPMVYHKLCYRDVEWIGRVTHQFQVMTHKPVWPIVQAVGEPTNLSSEEFRRSIKIGLESSGSGVIVFTARHVENEEKWDDLKQAFTTQADSKQ